MERHDGSRYRGRHGGSERDSERERDHALWASDEVGEAHTGAPERGGYSAWDRDSADGYGPEPRTLGEWEMRRGDRRRPGDADGHAGDADGHAGDADVSYTRGAADGRPMSASEPRRGRAPRSYQRPDDRILDAICERIVRETDIDASNVEVKVARGEVTLNGTVADEASKQALEQLARGTFGVTSVQSRLDTRPSRLNS